MVDPSSSSNRDVLIGNKVVAAAAPEKKIQEVSHVVQRGGRRVYGLVLHQVFELRCIWSYLANWTKSSIFGNSVPNISTRKGISNWSL